MDVQDLRYALRLLRRSPGFTAVAVLSLALGIGANTAIFSLIDAVLLRLLPVKDPESLVRLAWGHPGQIADSFSYPMFRELRDRSPVFSGIFAWDRSRFDVGEGDATESTPGVSVSGQYFSALGVTAAVGRLIAPEDDRDGAASPVAVLSYGYWRRRFGGDQGVVGRTIRVHGVACTIIGVAPPEFFGTDVGSSPELAIPLGLASQVYPGSNLLEARDATMWLNLMARRSAGVSLAQAQARLSVLWPEMLREAMPAYYTPSQVRQMMGEGILLSEGGTGFSELRRRFSKPLYVLMAMVGLVLLIACANIANLLLARAAARQRELAVRVAVGAGRARLVRQMLTENLLLAGLGSAAGVLLAQRGSRVLVGMLSTNLATVQLDLAPNARVLAFTTALAVLTGVLFGLAPIWHATRVAAGAALLSARGVIGRRSRWPAGKLLVVAQVALSVVLLAGAGLFVRSFQNLFHGDPGFRREGVLLAPLEPLRSGYQMERLAGFYQQVLDRVIALPGVRSASVSHQTPLSGSGSQSTISVEGYTPRPGESMVVYFNYVGPRYFETMGTRLLAGREFDSRDTVDKVHVAIINESVARAYFRSQNPVGRHISVDTDPDRRKLEIIAVVKDAPYRNIREHRSHTVYVAYQQQPKRIRAMTLSVRAASSGPGGLAAVASAVRRQLMSLQSGMPVTFRTFEEQVDQTLVQERLLVILAGVFGLLATGLACLGLYGVMAYTVARRSGEIGIRMALGAQRGQVLRSVLGESLKMILAGVAAGVAAALALSRVIASMLYGMSASEPGPFAAAAALMLLVGAAAGYVPARRAARLDPIVALRYD